MNPTRRGMQGALVEHVRVLGIEPITGEPCKPTSQGKSERFHHTLLRYLHDQPLARGLDELQAMVDSFDQIHDTQCPRQGLPGHLTPAQAGAATPIAEPPRPSTADDEPIISVRAPTSHKPRALPGPQRGQ